jgi:hypothetical protein
VDRRGLQVLVDMLTDAKSEELQQEAAGEHASVTISHDVTRCPDPATPAALSTQSSASLCWGGPLHR